MNNERNEIDQEENMEMREGMHTIQRIRTRKAGEYNEIAPELIKWGGHKMKE